MAGHCPRNPSPASTVTPARPVRTDGRRAPDSSAACTGSSASRTGHQVAPATPAAPAVSADTPARPVRTDGRGAPDSSAACTGSSASRTGHQVAPATPAASAVSADTPARPVRPDGRGAPDSSAACTGSSASRTGHQVAPATPAAPAVSADTPARPVRTDRRGAPDSSAARTGSSASSTGHQVAPATPAAPADRLTAAAAPREQCGSLQDGGRGARRRGGQSPGADAVEARSVGRGRRQKTREMTLATLALLAAGLAAAAAQFQYYTVPEPTLEALKPKGLRVSIPDEPGVQLFAFHGNVNKPMEGLEGGHLSRDILKPKNGRWVFEDPRVRLKLNDTIYFWLYVQVDGLGYRRDDQKWTVTGFVDPDTPPAPGPAPTPAPKPTPAPQQCGATATRVKGQPSCQGKLIFEDNFDGLDLAKWAYDVRIAGSPEYEFVAYKRDAENSYTKNGILVIRPSLMADTLDITKGSLQLDGCSGLPGSAECTKKAVGWDILPPVVSARLRTKDSFSFLYGRVEVRAKLPSGDWIYPEVWLEPKEVSYGREYASGQVRLALSRGNRDLVLPGGTSGLGSRRLEAGCVMGLGGKVRKELGWWDKQSSGWCDDFHVYSLEWTPDHMLFSVDGQQVHRITPPEGGFGALPDFSAASDKPWSRGSNMAPFDKEFYLTLGLGVGGISEFPDKCLTSLPGSGYHPKPWKNTGFNAMLTFWRDRSNWHPTWDSSGESSALQVDYVKVWAL
ncbi:beta-1,3-glucan-binding protein 1-like [Bacillus rossius redtenbacheri]|uniref:beta-1,3-glucan-binding protein 1-like n=1 Tax=Bacillus rossius redtenbacheri TaxID=93214 RepID=UPI002FDEF85A